VRFNRLIVSFAYTAFTLTAKRDLRHRLQFRHKGPAEFFDGAMEPVTETSWTSRIVLTFLVLLIVGAGALAFYASSLKPPHRTYEQVIPNDRFPG
jgi:hypothetical protein